MSVSLANKARSIRILGMGFNNWVLDSSQLLILIAIFIFPASYLEVSQGFTLTLFFKWLILKLIVWMTFYAIIKSYQKVFNIWKIRKINYLEFLGVCTLAGLIIAVEGTLLIHLMDLPDPLDFSYRLITTVFASIAAMTTLSISGRQRRNNQLERLRFVKAQKQSKYLQMRNDKDSLKIITEYEGGLKKRIRKIFTAPGPQFSIFDAMEDVRSISKELQSTTTFKYTSSGSGYIKKIAKEEFEFFIHSFKNQALSPIVFSFVLLSLYGLSLTKTVPGLPSYLVVLTISVITFSIHFMHGKYLETYKSTFKTSLLFNVLNLVIILTIEYAFYLENSEFIQKQGVFYRLFFVFMTYVFFCILGHLVQGSGLYEEYLLLSTVLQNQEPKFVVQINKNLCDSIAKDWSNYLHNEISSLLLSMALSRKKKYSQSDLMVILDMIDEKSFIENIRRSPRAISLSSYTRSVSKMWGNLIEIDFSISDDLRSRTLSRPTLSEISEVIAELIANAVRHGHAASIDFSLTSKRKNRIFIRSVNDGLPYKPETLGLGSVLLDEISPSNWSIKNVSNKVVTEILLVEI